MNLQSNSLQNTSTSSTYFVCCPICFRNFKSENGLKRHYNTINKYNIPHKDLVTIPNNLSQEYKNILIQQIHRQLPLSFTRMGRRVLSIPCTESQFVAVFAGHIHQFSNNPRVYKCRFHGESAYLTLTKILGDSKWGQKCYNQNQQTYIVFEQLSNQTVCSNIDKNQDDVDPLELILNQNKLNSKKKKRKPKVTRGEFLVEWKKKIDQEIDGHICTAGFIILSFYISQRRL
ncbi:3763_t:CDS:1 [Scutellospora calospora]|uniref:3763_t:CDS:1 n=1 Tax=Scutellospora calospora TaxID=85575 RepID=A0ACA9JUA3_9GLOM|nr:3763_t:CDS:1 [Scutellospora calospora]